jgi:hypothetical protein
MTSRKTEALHALAREKHESRDSTTRRNLIRTAIGGGAAALLFGSATGPVAAQSGAIPAPTDPAFLKFRGDRLRLVERSSAPAAPSSGRVLFYTDGSDL